MGKVYKSKWDRIIMRGKQIALSYDTPVTLRQLFYRLVAAQLIPNNKGAYNTLSSLTAEGRRDGTFPELIDTTRSIVEPPFFDSPADAIRNAARYYRGDRLADAPVSVYLGVEKRGMIAQLDRWFMTPYSIPILPLGGFSSQSFINRVKADTARRAEKYGRNAVFLYAGDFDASGVAIDRVFNERTQGCFSEVRRVALNPLQVSEFGLVRQQGKVNDNNVEAFFERYDDEAWYAPGHYTRNRHGDDIATPVQVELDALDPNDLHDLFTDAVSEFLYLSEISSEGEADDFHHIRALADLAELVTTDELRDIIKTRRSA